jgi:hypothetical protein
VVGRVGHADLRSGLTGGGVPHLGDGLAAGERPSQRPAVDGRGVGVANGGVSLDATGPLVADSGRSPHKSQCPEAAWSRSSWWIDGAVARHVPCVDSECRGGRYRLRPPIRHRATTAAGSGGAPTTNHQSPDMAAVDPMCWQAWQVAANAVSNWNGFYREGEAGNHQLAIPDGQLCSASRTQAAAAHRWPRSATGRRPSAATGSR